MDERYPTEDDLKSISEWDYKSGYGELGKFVIEIWNYDDYATLSEKRKDDVEDEYVELRLITGGWSGNESIVNALMDNMMFRMLCWNSSHRGGLHIFHIPIRFLTTPQGK